MFEELRDGLSDRLFRRAYRMTKSSFDLLYAIIRQRLDDEFFPSGGGACGVQSPYTISTKIRLSIALHYFVGGSVYDLMQVNGVSLQSVYDSVWGVVVDVINNTPAQSLTFIFPAKSSSKKSPLVFAHGVVPGSIMWLVRLMALSYVL